MLRSLVVYKGYAAGLFTNHKKKRKQRTLIDQDSAPYAIGAMNTVLSYLVSFPWTNRNVPVCFHRTI